MIRKTSYLLLAVITLIFGLNSLSGLTVNAQDSTAVPSLTPIGSPVGNGGKAQWTISDATFTSNYPKGFSFSIKASSSAGKVTNAQVVWRLSPNLQKNAVAKFDDATGSWVGTWIPSAGGDSAPAWVGFQWWFVLNDDAGNSFQTPSKYDEYADNTHNWGRLESEDIIVFWERPIPDRVGQMVIDAMAQNRQLYISAFGEFMNYKPRAILYDNIDSFAEWNVGGTVKLPGGGVIAGLTSKDWGGTVQWFVHRDEIDLAYGTVPHETGHLYQNFSRAHGALQWWVEGDATFFEIHQQYDYRAKAAELMKSGKFGSLRDDVAESLAFRAHYDIGYSFIKYLVDTYGIEVHLKIVKGMQSGLNTFDAIEAAVGKPFDEIEYDWRASLGLKDPTVPTAQPTFVIKVMPTPTFRSFGPKKTATPTPSS